LVVRARRRLDIIGAQFVAAALSGCTTAICGARLESIHERPYIPTARSEDASMKLALIALGLLATTGVVYAARVLC